MARAAILGLDTAAGAYLARLLVARGYDVGGSGGTALLARLGVAGAVAVGTPAAVVARADEVFDLRGDPAAIATLLAGPAVPRLFVAVAPGDGASVAMLVAARATGRFVATGRVHAHESRLGPGTSPVARIVAAAAAGAAFDPADLATATDCGWTAEYVDAMWRMLQRPAPEDLAIATGHLIAGVDAARVAAAWFKRPPPGPVATPAAAAADPRAAHAALGWRATTSGDDLVAVLCEGAAADTADG